MKTISDAQQKLEESLQMLQNWRKNKSYFAQMFDQIETNILSAIFALDVANNLLDLEKNEFDLTIRQAQINSQVNCNLSKAEFFTD